MFTKKPFQKLLHYSRKCAQLQTKDVKIAEKYNDLIDGEVLLLKEKGFDFSFYCGGIKYSCPVSADAPYIRPLFCMSTHKKIAEAKADDTHALDFDVPSDTGIYSVSDGIVSAIQCDSVSGGNSPLFAGKDNFLYIFNREKNRICCYRHLAPFDNFQLNQTVKKGELLGHTGMTGYVITPHLHFAIYRIKKKSKYILESMKIKFVF